MKKKNNNTAAGKQQSNNNNYFGRKGHKTTAQQFNAGKYYGNSGRGYLSEGNIFGENEEDYYSHAMSA